MRKPMPFGKYLLLDRIAVGGMAEVFAAKTFGVEGFERLVAIKRILPTMVEDDEFITMFIDEARIAALLSHANLVQIFDLGKFEDTYYIAMEYIAGRDVRLIIDKFKKRNQTVPIPMAVFMMSKICEGLDYAHRKKDAQGHDLAIIHRDISPQNVLVSYEGDVKIIDFGIAKAAGRLQKTQAGILKGKFGYMSPEQVKGIPIDHRSDLYSAGVMLYEMLTGSKLFTGESDFSTLEKVRAGEVRAPTELNPNIPPALERIVLKALAKDRDDRYQWGSEFHDDLARFLYQGDTVYSTKSLAGFMKEAFADEARKEMTRQQRWWATAPEETSDFESTSSMPPQHAPAAVIAARDAHGGGANGLASASASAQGKVRIGPPSAFMTAELRLQDRTALFEPFHGAAEPALADGPRRAPPVGDDDRSMMVTEAVSLAELGLVDRPTQVRNAADIEPRNAETRRSIPPPVKTPNGVGRVPPPVDPVGDETLPPGEVDARVLDVAVRKKPEPAPVPGVAAPRRPTKMPRIAMGVLGALIVFTAGVWAARNAAGPETGTVGIAVSGTSSFSVTVDGRNVAAPYIAKLPVGEHRLVVSAEGFETHEQKFTLGKEPLKVEVALEEATEEPTTDAGAEDGAANPDGTAVAGAGAEGEPEEAERDPSRRAAEDTSKKEGAEKLAAAKVDAAKVDAAKVDAAKVDAAKVDTAKVDTAKAAKPEPVKPEPVKPDPLKEAVARLETVKAGSTEPAAPGKAEPLRISAPLPPGSLMIFSNPPGAIIAVDGKMFGKAPQLVENLAAGKMVEVKLVLPGHKPLAITQEVPTGKRESLRLTLEPLGGATAKAEATERATPAVSDKGASPAPAASGGIAKLTAMCVPVAKVLVDGRDTGRWTPVGPANPIELSTGKHVVTCETADGTRSNPQEFVMEADRVYPFRARIQ